jgi:cytoskeletal protein CcmA (bactofilin family)
MVIPAGAVISGSLETAGDADIAGRVEGDVTLKGGLTLFKSASVTGAVSAGSGHVDGTVEGPVKCSAGLAVGATGRINADIYAGGDVEIAGCVTGGVSVAGKLRLGTGCVVNGDVRAGVLVMEEGAALNGLCSMLRAPKEAAAGTPEEKQGD